jgi:hypothetical protein
MQEDYVKDGEYLPAVQEEFLGKSPIIVDRSTDAADVVKTTQSIRLHILAERLKRGVSEDAKELNVDLQLLRDLDTAALTTRKIDVEERSVSDAERASEQTNALLKMLGGSNPFAVDITTGQLRNDLVGRPREAALPEPVIVPGHTKQGTDNLNYADFVDDPDADPEDVDDDDSSSS